MLPLRHDVYTFNIRGRSRRSGDVGLRRDRLNEWSLTLLIINHYAPSQWKEMSQDRSGDLSCSRGSYEIVPRLKSDIDKFREK